MPVTAMNHFTILTDDVPATVPSEAGAFDLDVSIPSIAANVDCGQPIALVAGTPVLFESSPSTTEHLFAPLTCGGEFFGPSARFYSIQVPAHRALLLATEAGGDGFVFARALVATRQANDALGAFENRRSIDAPTRLGVLREPFHLSVHSGIHERAVTREIAIQGSKQFVIDKIMKMKTECGYEDFSFLAWFELGGFEGREVEDQMQLFAEEVMPVSARECGGKVELPSVGLDYVGAPIQRAAAAE